jgi:hypothetical protein
MAASRYLWQPECTIKGLPEFPPSTKEAQSEAGETRMPVTLVKQHRRSHRLLRKALKTVLLIAFSGLALAALLFGIRNSSSQSLIAEMARHGFRAAMNGLELTPDYRTGRQMFPYSVVPGGLRNLRDAKDSIDSDPVVALHYRDLHIENLQLRRTAAAMDVFVSYRVQNAVYWTGRRIHMAKGELVLVDGKNVIRARCGNRIAFELPPEAPKAPPLEPPPEVFEYGLPPSFSPGEPPGEAPPEPVPESWPPVFIAPVPCCAEYVGPPINPIAATPEPSTFLLVGAGISLLAMRMKFRKRQ